MTNTLAETSNYYLLAWRPDAAEQKGGRFRRVEVNVAGHPKYTVRLSRGHLEAPPKPTPRPQAKAKRRPR